mgnify:CR=1 FL=1
MGWNVRKFTTSNGTQFLFGGFKSHFICKIGIKLWTFFLFFVVFRRLFFQILNSILNTYTSYIFFFFSCFFFQTNNRELKLSSPLVIVGVIIINVHVSTVRSLNYVFVFSSLYLSTDQIYKTRHCSFT